jgi:hypothetical protein
VKQTRIKGMGRELVHVDLAVKMFRFSKRTLYNRISDKTYTLHRANGVVYVYLPDIAKHLGKIVYDELMRQWKFDETSNTYVPAA